MKADPPDIAKIPADDAVGVTVILITASYRGQEFVRVGYYVNNEYDDLELKDNPPSEPQFAKLVRTIAAEQPRVTKFKVNWDPVSAGGLTTEGSEASANAANSDSNTYTNGQESEMATEDVVSADKCAGINGHNAIAVEQ
jgi:histone chaperone ASF1